MPHPSPKLVGFAGGAHVAAHGHGGRKHKRKGRRK